MRIPLRETTMGSAAARYAMNAVVLPPERRNEGVATSARSASLASLARMEKKLSDGRAWMLGDEHSIIDILNTYCLFLLQVNALHTGSLYAIHKQTLILVPAFPPAPVLGLLTPPPLMVHAVRRPPHP